jgi:hypothetical protein
MIAMKAQSISKIEQMKTLARDMSHIALIDAYRITVDAADPSPAARLVKSVLQDELEHRYPVIAEATESWVEDLDTEDTQDDVVLRCLAKMGK